MTLISWIIIKKVCTRRRTLLLCFNDYLKSSLNLLRKELFNILFQIVGFVALGQVSVQLFLCKFNLISAVSLWMYFTAFSGCTKATKYNQAEWLDISRIFTHELIIFVSD